jgi:hypothetical protein
MSDEPELEPITSRPDDTSGSSVGPGSEGEASTTHSATAIADLKIVLPYFLVHFYIFAIKFPNFDARHQNDA